LKTFPIYVPLGTLSGFENHRHTNNKHRRTTTPPTLPPIIAHCLLESPAN